MDKNNVYPLFHDRPIEPGTSITDGQSIDLFKSLLEKNALRKLLEQKLREQQNNQVKLRYKLKRKIL